MGQRRATIARGRDGRATPDPPYWSRALRQLREAHGVTREAWSGLLGYGLFTVKRWESGQSVPDAAAEAALVALCQQRNLFRRLDEGVLRGVTPTATWLADLLGAARLSGAPHEPPVSQWPATLGEPGSGSAVGEGRLASPGPVPPIPVWLTPCIGREDDLAEVRRLLHAQRLVTLTGPAGAGKTRLSVAVAEQAHADFADGAWFVDLALLTDRGR